MKELQEVSFRMLVQGHDDHHVDELVTCSNKLRGVSGSAHDLLTKHFEKNQMSPQEKSRLEDQTFGLLCEWMGMGGEWRQTTRRYATSFPLLTLTMNTTTSPTTISYNSADDLQDRWNRACFCPR